MAFAGFGLGTIGSLAFGASGSSAIKNGLIVGAINGVYQGRKKGRSFQWGGGATRSSLRRSKSSSKSMRSKSRRSKRWVQDAEESIRKKRHVGLFSKKARDHGMSTTEFACKVLANRNDFDAKTVKQANFYRNINKSHRC